MLPPKIDREVATKVRVMCTAKVGKIVPCRCKIGKVGSLRRDPALIEAMGRKAGQEDSPRKDCGLEELPRDNNDAFLIRNLASDQPKRNRSLGYESKARTTQSTYSNSQGT